jgi:hypothetical protein
MGCDRSQRPICRSACSDALWRLGRPANSVVAVFLKASRFIRDVRRARWPIVGVAATAVLANLATMAISGQTVFANRCVAQPLCGVGGRALLVIAFLTTAAATVVAVRTAFPVRSTKLEQRSRNLHALVVPLSEIGQQMTVAFYENPPRLTFDSPAPGSTLSVPCFGPFTGQELCDAIDGLGRLNVAPALRGMAEQTLLSRVTLLSSRSGSDLFVEPLATYLRRCGLTVETVTGLNFTDLDEVGSAVDGAIDRLVEAGVAEGRIGLDVTPGRKLTSIGVSFASLHREVLIQYVDRHTTDDGNERWRVTTYDTTLRQK